MTEDKAKPLQIPSPHHFQEIPAVGLRVLVMDANNTPFAAFSETEHAQAFIKMVRQLQALAYVRQQIEQITSQHRNLSDPKLDICLMAIEEIHELVRSDRKESSE